MDNSAQRCIFVFNYIYRTYEELKTKLAEDVQSRVKMTITTKVPPSHEEMSIDGEVEDGMGLR